MTYHDCGGTILIGGADEQEHRYCDRCHAFQYVSEDDEPFPTGTNEAANKAAWDDGELCSPDNA